jgi:acyl-lipid omega-6 desaturase (Delta-12 desaturase)
MTITASSRCGPRAGGDLCVGDRPHIAARPIQRCERAVELARASAEGWSGGAQRPPEKLSSRPSIEAGRLAGAAAPAPKERTTIPGQTDSGLTSEKPARESAATVKEAGANENRRSDSRALREQLSSYASPHRGRALFDIATSVVPYLSLSAATYWALGVSYLLVLALAVPAAACLVRIFIVFHDCSHGAFLASRRANTWLGVALGLLLYSPFVRWRHDHAVHHASSGDLDRRGVGDVRTLTVGEYRALSLKARLGYRLVRNPILMFGLGPVIAMIIGPRIVARGARPHLRRSVIATDIALAVLVGSLCWLIGWRDYLLVWAPAALLAGSVGIWLFYVQHQFEDAYWESGETWSYADAALRGSSYLRLPKLLQFLTGNIGLHTSTT